MRDSKFADEEELEGRTVKKVVWSGDCMHDLILVFTDGTFTKISDDPGYYGDSNGVCFDDEIREWDVEAMKKAGV